jgi:hypothetical protein
MPDRTNDDPQQSGHCDGAMHCPLFGVEAGSGSVTWIGHLGWLAVRMAIHDRPIPGVV